MSTHDAGPEAQANTALLQELETLRQRVAQLESASVESDRVARHQTLLSIVGKIRESLELDSIFQDTATEVRQLLDADRVGIFHLDASTGYHEGEFIGEDVRSPFPKAMGQKVRDRCFGDEYSLEYKYGRIQALRDIYNAGLQDCHVAVLAPFEVRANLVVPLLKGEELWGLVCVHQCSGPRHWLDEEIDFVRQIATHLGVALQQAEQMTQLRQQSMRLAASVERERAVSGIVHKIRQTLDLETIFAIATDEIQQLLRADRVGIYRFNPDWSGEFVCESVAPGWKSLIEAQQEYPELRRNVSECSAKSLAEGPGIASRSVDTYLQETQGGQYRQGKLYRICNNIYEAGFSPCYINLLEVYQARAYTIVAIYRGQKLWGLLAAYQNSGPRDWNESEINFLVQVGSQLGVAVHQAELFAQSQERSAELENTLTTQLRQRAEELARDAARERAVATIIERIRQTLDIGTIFSSATQELRQFLECDRVAVYRFNSDWSGTFVSESVGEGWVPLVGPDIKTLWPDTHLQETQGGRYRNHETFAVEDVRTIGHSDCHVEILEQFQVRAYAIAPVFVGDRLWGLLAAYQNSEPRPWEDREISLLAQVGNQFGVALQQAKLFQKTQAQAIELRETLANLNAIVDNLADGLLVTDPAGQISRFNPALKKMFGFEEDIDLGGQHLLDLFPPQLTKLVEETQANPEESVTLSEVPLGGDRIGQALATSILKADGEECECCFGAVILIRDVTAEKEVDRMKTDFLATVSHELRTPLTSVLGFASIIKEKLDETIFPAITTDDRKVQKNIRKVGANINIIVSEAERLTALINDVLDIAKMEAGRVEWNLEATNPQEILEQAIAATSSLFEKSGLKLARQFDAKLPEIVVDRDRIVQVVINLISNAVKFTSEGAVTCQATTQDDALVVSVIDMGIGIAPEDQALVFERFKQVGNILTDKPKGTGLGLPICKQIVEYHGGDIWVESEVGKGSTFFFSVPLTSGQPTQHELVNVDTLVRRLKQQIVPKTEVTSTENRTVLVVDDEANIRELLRDSLEKEGYKVAEAIDGMDAIERAKTIKPDLIVLDIMMPQINGFDVAAILKNDPETMDIPIIVLSLIEDRKRGYRIGIDRYLTKPINKQKLLSEIDFLIEQGTSAKKVLVVDRNSSTLRTLADTLLSQGYNVVEASDGKEGVEKAIATKPDTIIIDSLVSQEVNFVKTLRFANGLENVSLIFTGDGEILPNRFLPPDSSRNHENADDSC
ncbi:MAG: GAF domain-containing protein [Cyanobacteriota bacterium]|nr:GAF domain-containing protein [Cyanobacteriota bacterium]